MERITRIVIEENCPSLEDLITKSPRWRKQFKGLNTPQRLSLAVNIASSLLQLHATPWLSEHWCKKSIYFPVNEEQPYVMTKLDTSPVSSTEIDDDYLNPYLVALGILLLELSQGKSFAEWISGRSDITIPTDDIKDKACVASKWLSEDAKFNVGEAYSEVVKRCLECSLTPVQPQKERTFTNEKFREAVYCNIIAQLENICDTFNNPLKLLVAVKVF